MQLPNATNLERPMSFETWLIAGLVITYDDAVAVLSAPHFIERDTRRTAGGAEAHWSFRFPCGTKVAIVLSVPYDEARIFADPPNTSDVIQYLQPLIEEREIRVADPPILIR